MVYWDRFLIRDTVRPMKKRLNRRQFLSGAGMALLALSCPARAFAFGSNSLFEMRTLAYDGPWERRHGAQARMIWEVMKRTSIEAKLKSGERRLSSPDLYLTPFLYMSGDGDFSPFVDEETARLRRFLLFGGFLFIDGNLEGGSGFDDGVRREMARVFPDHSFEVLPPEHTLFKSFYLLDGRWGRVRRKSYIEGLSRDNRTMVVYSQNDVGGAWMRDNFGNWQFPCIPGGERQREMAFRFGINLVMYSLCTNYKSDQVHIPFILKRRRR